MLKRMKSEKGQAIVEFALCAVILVMLLTAPVDYFRFIFARMNLSSATSASLQQLSVVDVLANTEEAALKTLMGEYYGDRFNFDDVTIIYNEVGSATTINYPYPVYSSDRESYPNFQDKFDNRPANYTFREVTLKCTFEITPITFWGRLFFTPGGGNAVVETPVYSRDIYLEGFTP